jgi:hypothetical protein
MFFAFNVDVVAIAEVIAFATAPDVDETMNGLTLAERLADVALGFFHGNLSGDDQLDVEVLRVGYFFVVHEGWYWFAKIAILCRKWHNFSFLS